MNQGQNKNTSSTEKEQKNPYKEMLKAQIVKLALFAFLTVIIASITTTGKVSYDQKYYFLQNKVLNKNTRGIFPSLSGETFQLRRRWKIVFQIGEHFQDYSSSTNYHMLTFKASGDLSITAQQQGCWDQQFKYKWKTSSYNLQIIKEPIGQQDADFDAPDRNLKQQDIEIEGDMNLVNSTSLNDRCGEYENSILNQLQFLTIWTISNGQLYLLSEPLAQEDLSSIILLTPI